MNNMSQTLEKSKNGKINVGSIIKKIDKYMIRFDHPLQREAEQWTPVMKGNMVSDILQGNPIHPLVFAEQVINNIAIIWDLDGKQRCSNIYSFAKNGYKIHKGIRRPFISYQIPVVTEDGKPAFDDDGFPKYEMKTFDIRGKYYSDLPEELQDRINDYNFDIIQYLNCSDEDIAYHITRYNEGKAMSAPQKGIVRLGAQFAEAVKSIAAMSFFKDLGGYKVCEFRNGVINRVIVESVMASKYLDEWKKKQEDMCEFLRDNANISDFEEFGENVERLEKVITDDVASLFDSKDSFVYFGLFNRFLELGKEDVKFVEFMTAFKDHLHTKKVGDTCFDDLKDLGTKDKNTVVAKISHLTTLMNEYFEDDEPVKEPVTDTKKEMDSREFISKEIEQEVSEDDVEFYNEMLDDLTLNVDNNSKLLQEQNRNSLLAVVAYACQNDIDLDDWIVHYFKNNNMYVLDQNRNFFIMRTDLKKFMRANAA